MNNIIKTTITLLAAYTWVIVCESQTLKDYPKELVGVWGEESKKTHKARANALDLKANGDGYYTNSEATYHFKWWVTDKKLTFFYPDSDYPDGGTVMSYNIKGDKLTTRYRLEDEEGKTLKKKTVYRKKQ